MFHVVKAPCFPSCFLCILNLDTHCHVAFSGTVGPCKGDRRRIAGTLDSSPVLQEFYRPSCKKSIPIRSKKVWCLLLTGFLFLTYCCLTASWLSVLPSCWIVCVWFKLFKKKQKKTKNINIYIYITWIYFLWWCMLLYCLVTA